MRRFDISKVTEIKIVEEIKLSYEVFGILMSNKN